MVTVRTVGGRSIARHRTGRAAAVEAAAKEAQPWPRDLLPGAAGESPSGLCPHGAAHLHATTTLEHTPSRRPLVFGTLDSFGATCFWRHGAGVRRWMDGGEVEPSRARRRPGRTPGGAARRVSRLRLWARSAAPLRRAGRGQMLRLLFHRSLACSPKKEEKTRWPSTSNYIRRRGFSVLLVHCWELVIQ